jgi:hypothetical protein
MTRIKAGRSVDDADDGPAEGVVCIPGSLDEGFAKEEREFVISANVMGGGGGAVEKRMSIL